MTDKTRETRLRRMAKRRGLILSKSRTRDPNALDHGTYRLTSAPDAPFVDVTRVFACLRDAERHFGVPSPPLETVRGNRADIRRARED